MAGVTNVAFRTLCRELEQSRAGTVSGLYVCEMITSRGIVERNPKTFDMLTFAPGERIRSVQLYGVDPQVMARGASIVCEELGVQHIDVNLGCPVPKVTVSEPGRALCHQAGLGSRPGIAGI